MEQRLPLEGSRSCHPGSGSSQPRPLLGGKSGTWQIQLDTMVSGGQSGCRVQTFSFAGLRIHLKACPCRIYVKWPFFVICPGKVALPPSNALPSIATLANRSALAVCLQVFSATLQGRSCKSLPSQALLLKPVKSFNKHAHTKAM